jgi:nitrogen fixation protein NifU and related proteins
MNDLRSLYQEVILDHNKSPRNAGRLDSADLSADGDNPLCGDTIHLEIALDGDVLRQLAFEGRGCAISQASASLMTEAVEGKSRGEARALFEVVRGMLTGGTSAAPGIDLGKLEALAGVSAYPMRVKCATLAWHTLLAALKEDVEAPVSTES